VVFKVASGIKFITEFRFGTVGRDHVIAPDPDHLIPLLFHGPEDIGLLGLLEEMHGPVTGGMRITPGEKAAPGGDAHRILAVGVAEGDAVLQKRVQIRRPGCRIPHVGQGITAHLISDKQQDIRSFFHK
jgi:hypothetical protein